MSRAKLTTALAVVVPFVGLCLLWEALKALFDMPHSRLPHTWEVAAFFWERNALGERQYSYLGKAMLTTLQEAVGGMVLALAVGTLLGVVMGKRSFADQTLMPLVLLVRALPLVALAPPLIIWLGPDWKAKAIIAAIMCFAPIVISVSRGIRDVSDDQRQLFRSFGAPAHRVFGQLEVPSALGMTAAGIRVVAAWAVLGALAAEMPTGAAKGIATPLINGGSMYTSQPELLWCTAILASAGGIVLVIVSGRVFSGAAKFFLRTSVLPAGVDA